jgi:cobalamin synthase
VVHPAPLVPVQPGTVPAVASIVLSDGRVITGYAIDHTQHAPAATPPAVSRTAVNVALGGVGFLAVCGGLLLLTSFIAALTAFITQLITLAAVIFGGWIAVQVLGASGDKGGTTVNIRKAVIKRNHFHG